MPEWEFKSKDELIWQCCVYTYNLQHAKFHITFCDETLQRRIVEAIALRMNLLNPLSSGELKFDVDPMDFEDEDWQTVSYHEIDEQLRQDWNLKPLAENDLTPLYMFSLGTYRLHQGRIYLTHANQMELLEHPELLRDSAQFFAESKAGHNKELKIHRFSQQEMPEGWDESEFGPWCSDGAVLYGATLPSLYRSHTDE